MKSYSSEIPEKRVIVYTLGMPQYTLNYEVNTTSMEEIEELAREEGVEVTPDYIENHKYNYYSVTMPPGEKGRSAEINAIITDRYPLDKMEAVINNYLLDPTDEDAKVAFNEMQEFRKSAKEFADSIVNEINKD